MRYATLIAGLLLLAALLIRRRRVDAWTRSWPLDREGEAVDPWDVHTTALLRRYDITRDITGHHGVM